MEAILEETIAILNEILGIKPVLYASFAVEKVLGQSYQAHDIDLLIPTLTPEKKHALIQEFGEHGFTYLDQYEATFSKDGIDVELGNRAFWFQLCGFDSQGVYEISGPTFRYDLLSASNLLKLYTYLLNNPKRDPNKRPKDHVKVRDLRYAIEHQTTNFR